MEHVIVRLAERRALEEVIPGWLDSSRDGELLDKDVLAHDSTFILESLSTQTGRLAYLPVQQPLMLESLIVRPDLSAQQTAQALTRMVEYAIGEAFRRDAGELYFLTRDEETALFAERHKFRPLPDGLKVYRLNLLETFGC